MVERVPAEAFPPGEYLRDELEARGWTQGEFAEIIGRPVKLVNDIIAGRRGISPATAKEIAAALGTSAALWLNLDAAYQLFRADPPPERIAIEAKLRERFPVREMVKRGWIEPSQNPEVLQARLLRFYGISSIEEKPALAHAAKRKEYDDAEPNLLQEAWLYRVRQLAEHLEVPAYSEKTLRDGLERLRALAAAAEDIRHVPQVLADSGIRFVIVEPLPGSKIDGVCMWLNARAPVIGMSLRFDRIDNFWFVLRHEIEHVLRKDGRDSPRVDSELEEQIDAAPIEEAAANAAAADFCVPRDRLDDFISRPDPLYSKTRILGFASLLNVHPGLVVGQLRRRLGRWDLFAQQLVRIRHIITSTALTDGYGHVAPALS